MKPTEIIYKKPREGKTTELIKRCAENGGYIVSATQERAKLVFQMAKSMGHNIPFPLTFDELIHDMYYAKGVRKIYIDDAMELIQKIARGLEVEAIAIDDLSEAIEEMENQENKIKEKESIKYISKI